ncbi:hypothetical protein AAY473_034439 [Plecturocebus cupreus]
MEPQQNPTVCSWACHQICARVFSGCEWDHGELENCSRLEGWKLRQENRLNPRGSGYRYNKKATICKPGRRPSISHCPRLECSATISAHRSHNLLGSKDSSASASGVSGTDRHVPLFMANVLNFLVEIGVSLCYPSWSQIPGLKLCLPKCAPLSVGIDHRCDSDETVPNTDSHGVKASLFPPSAVGGQEAEAGELLEPKRQGSQ